MFKKMILIGALAGLAGLLIFGAVNRTLAKTGREGGSGVSRGSPDADLAQTQTHIWSEGEALAGLPAVAPAELSEDEIAGLLFMGEEEKLAQDVYLAFYEMWGLPVFNNIAGSEATHTAAVKTLLDAYGLEDPVSSQAGVFSDTSLAALYSDLVSRGSVSLEEALKVGALIEEIDILDLETWLAQTSNADIIRVYENLMSGSENHLRAFNSQYEARSGEAYQPSYLSQEAYETIVASVASGNNAAGGNGNRGTGRGGRP